MVNGLYHYLKEAWKKPGRDLLYEKMIEWRAGDSIVKVEKPLRLDKARALGYKAKKGFVVVLVRVRRGGRKRSTKKKGRKTGNQTIRKTLKMSYRWVAEIRAEKKYSNLEVLNSYWVGRDGKHYYFEVIMVDPERPEIKSDRVVSWVADNSNRDRAQRGLTSAGKKSRGLGTKSHSMKVRPSGRANNRKGK